MKLFTKIFLQVFVGCLALTLVPLFYLLHESQQQSLLDMQRYEGERFERMQLEFSSEAGLYRETAGIYRVKTEAYQDAALVNAFRRYFRSDSAALYRGGKAVFNLTPYEFSAQAVSGLTGSPADDLTGVQAVGEKRLMLFADQMNTAAGQVEVFYYKDVTELFDRTGSLLVKGLLFAAAMLALTGLVLFCGIRRSLWPLRRLQDATARIAKEEYRSRAPVCGRDEIGELAESFNRMADRIEEHVGRLSRANQSQLELIGSLAHELKTPLTAIIGYAETLLTVRLSEETRNEALLCIRDEGRRLSRLQTKMMELVELYGEDGEAVKLQKVRAADLLERLRDLTAHQLSRRQLRLETVCTPSELVFDLDGDLVMSLLVNLVDNACKASDEGDVIIVTADRDGFAVRDHGRGIPASEISRVTEAFYMVDKSRTRRAGGIGLGLALCSRIAKLHGASLVIESEEGVGTCVRMKFGGDGR